MDGPVGADPPSVGIWKALPWANESLWDWEGESVPTNWAAARLDVTLRDMREEERKEIRRQVRRRKKCK